MYIGCVCAIVTEVLRSRSIIDDASEDASEDATMPLFNTCYLFTWCMVQDQGTYTHIVLMNLNTMHWQGSPLLCRFVACTRTPASTE